MVRKKGHQKERHIDKLWKIPGIPEAVNMLVIHANQVGYRDCLEMIKNGDLGEEIRDEFLELDEGEPFYFARDKIEECEIKCINDRLEVFCDRVVPKIRDLWELTDDDQQVIHDWLLSNDEEAGERIFRLIIQNVETEKAREIETKCFQSTGIKTKINDQLSGNNRIILDVTDMDYKSLNDAYKAISFYRDIFGGGRKFVRKGAPESIDTIRALSCFYAVRKGLSRKEIAKMLKFPIYSDDNPSGSHPLLYKYLDKGRELANKLDKLSEYLEKLTGKEVDDDWYMDKIIR